MGPNLNIYGAYLRQPKSVAEYNDEADSRDMNRLAMMLRQQQVQGGQMAMQDAAAQRERQNALRGLMGQLGDDPQQNYQQLLRGGFAKEAQDYLKADLDARKTQAEIGKVGADTASTAEDAFKKRLAFFRDTAEVLVRTPQDAAGWIQAMYADPAVGQRVSSMMPVDQALARIPSDPAGFQQWLRQNILGMDKMLTQEATAARDAEAVRRNQATEALTRRGQDITARGQNLADARARDRLEFDRTKPAADMKPLPTTALKMLNESRDALGVVSSVNADLGALEKQIKDGKLSFGPLSNLINQGRNVAGLSSEESRNFASFKSTLERLRNESLRLNAGVQTEGDAIRAWNELFQNINDTELVQQRLAEIQRTNKRAADLQKLKADNILANYGRDPLDETPYEQAAAAVGVGAGGIQPGHIEDGYRFKGGNPADSKNWEPVK